MVYQSMRHVILQLLREVNLRQLPPDTLLARFKASLPKKESLSSRVRGLHLIQIIRDNQLTDHPDWPRFPERALENVGVSVITSQFMYEDWNSFLDDLEAEENTSQHANTKVLTDYMMEVGIPVPDVNDPIDWFTSLFNLADSHVKDRTLTSLIRDSLARTPMTLFKQLAIGFLMSSMDIDIIINGFKKLVRTYAQEHEDRNLSRVFLDIIRFNIPILRYIQVMADPTYTGEIVTLSAYPEGEPLDNYDENSRLIILGEPQQLRDIEKFGVLLKRLEEFIEDARSNRQIDGVDSFTSLAQKLLTQSVLTPERFKTFATSLIGGTAGR